MLNKDTITKAIAELTQENKHFFTEMNFHPYAMLKGNTTGMLRRGNDIYIAPEIYEKLLKGSDRTDFSSWFGSVLNGMFVIEVKEPASDFLMFNTRHKEVALIEQEHPDLWNYFNSKKIFQ